MKVDLVIRNARIIRHDGEIFGAVAVKDGKIVAVGSGDAMPSAIRDIDAHGRPLLPGIIDPHCHLGVNYPYDEDMRTETAAAASGGGDFHFAVHPQQGTFLHTLLRGAPCAWRTKRHDRFWVSLWHSARRAYRRDSLDCS